MNWKQGGEVYLPALNAAEDQFAIPTDLLARVAYQESHWRTDIVNCSVKSPAGAVGLMQLMPQFFPGVGVSWKTDIITAARYLANLHHRLQDWTLAVAAYNWGPGNIERFVAGNLQVLPLETENYVREVFGDVPITGKLTEDA